MELREDDDTHKHKSGYNGLYLTHLKDTCENGAVLLREQAINSWSRRLPYGVDSTTYMNLIKPNGIIRTWLSVQDVPLMPTIEHTVTLQASCKGALSDDRL